MTESRPPTAQERLAALVQSLAALVAREVGHAPAIRQAREIADAAEQIVFELHQSPERQNGA